MILSAAFGCTQIDSGDSTMAPPAFSSWCRLVGAVNSSTNKVALITVAAALGVMKDLGSCPQETMNQFELHVVDGPRVPLLGKAEAKAIFIAGPNRVVLLPARPFSVDFTVTDEMKAARSYKVAKALLKSVYGHRFSLQVKNFEDFYLSKVRKRL